MFGYNEGTLKMNQVRISPSGVNDLLGHFPYWFKSKVLKQDYDYGKPDNRVLGTVIHAMIENYYTSQYAPEYVLNQSSEYIEQMGVSDSWELINKADLMFDAWVEEFGSKEGKPSSLEQWVEFEPSDRIKISGTYDALFEHTLFDWKTTTKKKTIIDNYKNQLYLYAWLLRKQGKIIDNVGVCYIQQPLKSGKVNIVKVVEPIDGDYMVNLINRVKTASEKVIEAYDNEVIKNFLSEIEVKSPYDRSY